MVIRYQSVKEMRIFKRSASYEVGLFVMSIFVILPNVI